MIFANPPRWSDPQLARRAARIATCAHKQAHASAGAAEAHLRALRRRFEDRLSAGLRVYQCRVCGAWHVGRLAS